MIQFHIRNVNLVLVGQVQRPFLLQSGHEGGVGEVRDGLVGVVHSY